MANIIEINDISAPELEVFTKLTEKQLRHKLEPEKGIFIAESGKVIELALAAGCEPISLLMERNISRDRPKIFLLGMRMLQSIPGTGMCWLD